MRILWEHIHYFDWAIFYSKLLVTNRGPKKTVILMWWRRYGDSTRFSFWCHPVVDGKGSFLQRRSSRLPPETTRKAGWKHEGTFNISQHDLQSLLQQVNHLQMDYIGLLSTPLLVYCSGMLLDDKALLWGSSRSKQSLACPMDDQWQLLVASLQKTSSWNTPSENNFGCMASYIWSTLKHVSSLVGYPL